MATLTIADLDNGKRDLQTVDEVANSRAATATTRFGQQTTTLYEAIRRINAVGDAQLAEQKTAAESVIRTLGFAPPTPYAPGITVSLISTTVEKDGVVYAPEPDLVPFTTGAWDESQWYPIQNAFSTRDLLVFSSQSAAEAASAVLATGQTVEYYLTNGDTIRAEVSAGILVNARPVSTTASVFDQTEEFSPGSVGAYLAAAAVNVMAAPFLAVGDGVSDDTAKIQAAIDSLPATGGVVYLPPNKEFAVWGVNLAGSANDKSNVTIQGGGATSRLVKLSFSEINALPLPDVEKRQAQRANVIWAEHGHGHAARDLYVRGNKDFGGKVRPYCTKHTLGGVFLPEGRVVCTSIAGTNGTQNPTDRVFLITALGAGKTSSTTNISFDLAAGYVTEVTSQKWDELTGTGYMNSYELDNDFAFRSCVYFNGLTEPMRGVEIANVEATGAINGCLMPGAGPLFASLAGFGTLGARVHENFPHDTGATCIGGGKKVRAAITGNIIGKTSSSGIRCDEGSHECVISGNVIDPANRESAGGGVSIYKSDYVTVTGNYIQRALVGVTVLGGSTGVSVSGNTVKDCNVGIGLNGNTAGSLVGNTVSECTRGITVTGGSSNAVIGNTTYHNSRTGLQLIEAVGATVSSNTSHLNGTDGISIDAGSNQSVISENIVRQNNQSGSALGSGIAIHGAVSNLSVIGNRCFDPGSPRTQRYGIYSDGGLTGGRIVANHNVDNGIASIELSGSSALVAMNDSAGSISVGSNPVLTASSSGATVYLAGAAGSENFQIATASGTVVNRLVARGSSNGTSSPPSLTAEGTDADIDVRLIPKGAGLVRFGAHTAGAGTVSGYITVRDASGTVRKLAVVP